MMLDVSSVRNELDSLDKKQAYVKWWAKRSEFDLILNRLNIPFDDIKDSLDVKDDLYCIFIAKSTGREIAGYLDMQLNCNHTKGVLKNGLPVFRRIVSSIVASSLVNGEETDAFFDKLKIEIFYVDYPIKSKEAKDEIEKNVKKCLEEKFYILNRKGNHHRLANKYKENLQLVSDNAIQELEKYLASEVDASPKTVSENFNEKRNLIYFGAPGTGKSYNLNKDKDKLLENFPENYERVTFHPDYSYASFVGTYKPVPEGKDITYKYVPGPFMRILKKALDKPSEPFLLIIEEINRANVAAVFGDVFQLLDRENNKSMYPIDATEDMKTYINKDKIILPSNLFIWATMNSADQGVFMMDTAFKRRWDFKYFSINNNDDLIANTKVTLNNLELSWNDLRKAINDELSYKINEDKLIGPFFAFNDYHNLEIPTETFKDIFKNKIIMYLFEDAARSRRNELFSGVGKGKNITYSQVCEEFDKNGIEIFNDSIKDKFLTDDGE